MSHSGDLAPPESGYLQVIVRIMVLGSSSCGEKEGAGICRFWPKNNTISPHKTLMTCAWYASFACGSLGHTVDPSPAHVEVVKAVDWAEVAAHDWLVVVRVRRKRWVAVDDGLEDVRQCVSRNHRV